jgi:hypothetical protein
VSTPAQVADAQQWAQEEFATLCLGDARREARFKQVAAALAQAPHKSLPQALSGWAQLKAAYRLFGSAALEHQAIIDAHVQASVSRIGVLPVVLAVQDTTYVDFSTHNAVQGLGRLSKHWQRGLVVHSTLAISSERVPLGLLAQQVWTRPIEAEPTRHRRKERPTADKESQKWLDSVQVLNELKAALPDTQLISVADREADLYDLFALARRPGVDLLVRAAWNRALLAEHRYLWAQLEAAPLLGHCPLWVPAKPGRPARQVSLSVRAQPVCVKPPRHRRSEHLAPITLWAVLAREEHPEHSGEPIQWMLLSTVPTETLAQAVQRLSWYSARWGIEVWHRVLKTGCRIEQLLLRDAQALQRALGLFSIVAWRVLYATMLSRELPDASSTLLLDTEEWQALYCRTHEVPTPCAQPPTLGDAVRWIARLGGWIGRNNDRPPGAEVLWRGLQELAAITPMFRIMRQNL